jgi:uncharacterized protein
MRIFTTVQSLMGGMLLLAATSAHAQDRPVSLLNTEYREFTSTITGRAYGVFVALPDSYSADVTRKYPVLYMTDAHIGFPLITYIYRLMRLTEEVPEMIIIGLASPDAGEWAAGRRHVELSPTRVPERDVALSKSLGRAVRTGGGESFVRVFRDELVPDIERRYRTTPQRSFVGHSFGALFGAYALIAAPGLFDKFILVSPALTWDGGVFFGLEEKLASTTKTLPAEVFITVGGKESDAMMANAKRLLTTLGDRKYSGLTLHWMFYEDETHTTVFGPSFARALLTMFPLDTRQ